MEAVKLEILGIPFQLHFSEQTIIPIGDVLKPYIVSEFSLAHTKTASVITIENVSFDGLDPDQHFRQHYQTLSLESRGEAGYLFRYLTGQFLANSSFTWVRMWLPFERQMSIDHDGFANFTGDPSLRLVVWARSSIEGYCYMHGALVVIDGKYILLVGASGCGKTTLGNLFCADGAALLTEEDPFVLIRDDEPWVFSSPWPGSRGPAVPICGELSAIFYLRHAQSNMIRTLSLAESCNNLLRHSRTFNWLPHTIPTAIELLDKVSKIVPSYDFGFLPDASAVSAIREIIS